MNIKYCATNTLDAITNYPDRLFYMYFSRTNPYFQEHVVTFIIDEYYLGSNLRGGDIRYFSFWDNDSGEFFGTYKAEGNMSVKIEKIT